MAIRLNDLDELICGNFYYIGVLADDFAGCLIVFFLLYCFLGTDWYHLADVAQVNNFDVFHLVFLHMLGML